MSIVQNVETLTQQPGGNYEVTRFNALRHGVLSRHTVLPWENGDEYDALIEALVVEHEPRGQPRSILSRSWRASSGVSDACDWLKAPLIIAP